MTIRELSTLQEYPLNNELRTITPVQYENLKKDLTTNGQREPMLVMPDGTVLGGNHRLKAMKELGWTQVSCNIIDFIREGDDWYAVIDGEPNRQRTFKSKDQAMFQYAIWDNDPGYATYNKESLLKYADAYEVDYHDIRFTEEFTSLAQVENIVAPTEVMPTEDTPPKYEIVVKCKNEIEQQETYQKLVDLGYTCIKR